MKFLAGFFASLFALFSTATHALPVTTHPVTSSLGPVQQTGLTQDQLLALADDKYANGNLPLGDKKFVTTSPQKGYIYLCHANTDPSGGGAQKAGVWIHENTWNIHEKIAVQGHVSWPNAQFNTSVSGDTRLLTGNDLPSHMTGVFPIKSSDPASVYDKNPNSIKTQSFTDSLPLTPTYSDTPTCMGGEAGIMLTGVALFNGFDAGLRDAAAYEVQDSCNGHPQVSGEYHYHSLSSCITDIGETTVIGYALDGFPITGPKVADHKYLTTEDLDECHGITSEIMQDGKKVMMYHYVMTQDFPYSVSCFRGKPVQLQVISGGQGGMQSAGGQRTQGRPQSGMSIKPPQEAYTVCSGKSTGTSCSFSAPNGTVSGTCQNPSGEQQVCVPARAPGSGPQNY